MKILDIIFKKKPDSLIVYQEIALALRGGMDIYRAIESAYDNSLDKTLDRALITILKAIEEGRSISDAFKTTECKAFPDWFKLILSSESLSDMEKGSLLELKINAEKAEQRNPGNLQSTYFTVVFCIILLLIGIIYIFVFPQFVEIFYSTRVKSEFVEIMKFFGGHKRSLKVPGFFLIAITIFFLIPWKKIHNLLINKDSFFNELYAFFPIFAENKSERLIEFAPFLSNPLIMPNAHLFFKDIFSGDCNPEVLTSKIGKKMKEKGLDPLLCWCFTACVLDSSQKKINLDYFLQLLQTRSDGRIYRINRVIECVLYILLSLPVAFTAILVFVIQILLIQNSGWG
ncbi:MAG: type II secretion system F family protein [Candidatus Riflebacteria bacterium]|nr:type II secretion system F family protein [Candidatus Riflebacteria bacterium]